MPSTLDLLLAEREAQAEEEARPPFCDLESIRAFIIEHQPAASENISLEMCVLSIEEREKSWYVELIERDSEARFSEVLEVYKPLDPARRSKFVFKLSLWKSHNASLNELNYREGFSYTFEKVHSLKMQYDSPVGSIQIRRRIRAQPLPPPGLAAMLEVPDPARTSQAGDAALSTTPKKAGKRKDRANNVETTALESPAKKTRAAAVRQPDASVP